jgi:hypothetical protein
MSFLYDQRQYYYFIIESILFGNGTFIALSKGFASRECIVILTISIIVTSNFAAIDSRNWYVPIN